MVGAAGRGNAQATGGRGRKEPRPNKQSVGGEGSLLAHPRGRVSETERALLGELKKERLSDVVILLENGTVRVHAHRAVLACRS